MLAGLRKRFPQGDLEYVRTFATSILALLVLAVVALALIFRPAEVVDHALKGHYAGGL